MPLDADTAEAIAGKLGLNRRGLQIRPVAGGDIAAACVLQNADARVFVKTLPAAQAALLSAEADGLEAIAASDTLRVPEVVGHDVTSTTAWLALEWLELHSRGEPADARLGEQLAAMHRQAGESYGWRRDNFIGLTPQPNPETADWREFFLDHRLGGQFERLEENDPAHDWRAARETVCWAWCERFADHQPPASLIHGDLWSGNAAAVANDHPVVFDPAVHCADRECDLAMTQLFGGFSDAFYRAYDNAWPLPDGHRQRRDFYRLYHLLNHANLFGGGYPAAAARLCRELTAAA